jgi:Polypeptide deformylase
MFATDFTPSSRNREPRHTFGTVELQTPIDDLFETMRSGRGMGLAAPQTGVSERIIVFEFAGGSHAPGAPPVPATVALRLWMLSAEGYSIFGSIEWTINQFAVQFVSWRNFGEVTQNPPTDF